MNIKAAVSEYIIECEVREYSPRTITSYRNNLGIFQRFCEEELEITDVKDVSIATTRQFSQSLIQKGRKGTYINTHLKTIKSFLQYCYDEGYTAYNPRKNFKWCKEEKPVVRAFTEKMLN